MTREYRRIGDIQIFGLSVIQASPGKGRNSSKMISYRKNDPVMEKVIDMA